jgi:hypothetical protein
VGASLRRHQGTPLPAIGENRLSLPAGWTRMPGEKYAIEHASGFWRMSRTPVRGQMRYTLWGRVQGAWSAVESFNSAAEADTFMQEKTYEQ